MTDEELHDDDDEVIEFVPGVRQGIGLLIGVWGDGGAGKTLSASKMGRGLAAEEGEDLTDPATLARVDARVAYIDTDGRRAQHYAPRPGELPSADPEKPTFGFRYADFAEPFSPMRLQRFYDRAEHAGFKVIITDSFSLIWEGRGGVIDMHDVDAAKALVKKLERYEQDVRDNKNPKPVNEESVLGDISHWKRAKVAHRRMVTRIIQCRAHMIFAGHADDKMRIEDKEHSFEKGRGENRKTITYTKTEVTAPAKLDPKDRWVPICEKKFPRQLALSLILTPDAPGVPIPKKTLNEHFRPLIPLDRPLDERVGFALAQWARGVDTTSATRPLSLRTPSPDAAPAHPPAQRSLGGGETTSSPPPPSSTFPGDMVTLGSTTYDPALPCPLVSYDEMEPDDWRGWARALRTLIERADTPELKRAWEHHNQDDLLRLSSASPALRGWLYEALPKPDGVSSPPVGGGADDGSRPDQSAPPVAQGGREF